ncbi:ABC transporter ATP-binding protein [Thermoflavimicrobium daqui]|jgi:iron complex transport system ATP-binding protein|uniref:ABC transporter n=1 Tax=Thermoflavimicrobium daqui TaxID=2137476 RepID=A0A364K4D9_9BACL|nr:ABC transporter ATP-binding protein [Thermoflavimicrobium daqui]RAL24244.1 ABC transporter [Thermoflavimicrobium daqui]
MNLKLENVSFSFMQTPIIQDISLHVSAGQFVGIIGPNGSGKSTLLKTIYRVLKPNSGSIQLADQDIEALSSRYVFQHMAIVSQEATEAFDFSVQEMVLMGRTPHKRLFESDTIDDYVIVQQALARVNMEAFAKRSFMSLSGGEKQRVLIARALAQQAELIILDEPTNHLDIRYQFQLLNLVKNLDVSVIAALHDLNLASIYTDYLYVMQSGQIVRSGTPKEVLTVDLLREVFGVETEIVIHAKTGKPHITFISDQVS